MGPATWSSKPLGNVPENFTSSPPMEFASTSYNTLKGTHAFSWSIEKPTGNSNCASGGESEKLGLSCGASKIEAILFAGYGTNKGDCKSGFSAGSCFLNISSFAHTCCVGKTSCEISCDNSECLCGSGGKLAAKDPCYETKKLVAASVKCQSPPGPPEIKIEATTSPQ